MTKNFDYIKKLKICYLIIQILTVFSFLVRYFGLFAKFISKFIDIYDFYNFLGYVVTFGVLILIILKSMINNIKDYKSNNL